MIPGIFLRVLGSIAVDITLLCSMTANGAGKWSANLKTYLVQNVYFEYCTSQVQQCTICKDEHFNGRNETLFKIGLIHQPWLCCFHGYLFKPLIQFQFLLSREERCSE